MQDFKIIQERESPLFKRKEIYFELKSNVAPSRLDVVKIISKELSTIDENVKIKSIKGKFGSNKFYGDALIYESENAKNSIGKKRKRDEKLSEALKDANKKNGENAEPLG